LNTAGIAWQQFLRINRVSIPRQGKPVAKTVVCQFNGILLVDLGTAQIGTSAAPTAEA